MKRYGLFVGVDQYRDGISSLTCSCNDAQTLSYVFARESFDEVKYLDNDKANSEKVMDEVERMVDELAAGDLFVFYFAGHGREVNGEHFLVGPTGRPQPDLYRSKS